MGGENDLRSSDVALRLGALRKLCAGLPGCAKRGVNLHLHTNESFSSFESPSEAVWQAAREGLLAVGINDHYTVAGHREFREACHIAGLAATFSMEAVALDGEAARGGLRINDPSNPGRAYLCAKGITRTPAPGDEAAVQLDGLRRALGRRNREMTLQAGRVFAQRLGAAGPAWEDVTGLTPAGNTTERHVAKAIFVRLASLAGGDSERTVALAGRLCGARPASAAPAEMQDFVRSKLLKAGGLCYVEEDAEAFLPIESMRRMFLAFGSIPTYPALLDPITDWEREPGALLDRLQELGFHALEVIPQRNSRERLAGLLAMARGRCWPVFNGTEHNTAKPGPLLDRFSLDPEFEEWFADSARVLLGHQAECAAGRVGFVDSAGRPLPDDARGRFEHFRRIGASVLSVLAGRGGGGKI